jgi:WD40 repeat protein
MTSSNPVSFEEKLRAASQMPQPQPEFLATMRARLIAQPPPAIPLVDRLWWMFRRPTVAASMIVLLLIAGFLIAGPQRVFAAVRGILGYIPGVGIVNNSAPVRVLAEPVITVREGIAVTVASAVLTTDQTHIDYRIFGVPGNAYPDREDLQGCTQSEYLRLPDGSQMNRAGSGFPPIPANINDAVLVIPCIFNTLPGTVPENWEIPLLFAPAPPNMTMMPVVEVSASPEARSTEVDATPVLVNSTTATPPVESAVTVQKVIETADGYILVGRIVLLSEPGQIARMNSGVEIRDVNGNLVAHTTPTDITPDVDWGNPNESGWVAQFKAAGLAYPLTLNVPGVTLVHPNPNATASIEFDAGPNPQMGQEFIVNQDIQLLGHTLKLVSIRVESRNDYNFVFQVDPQVDAFSVQIEGYSAVGGGGGGKWEGEISRSLSYAQIPTGKLKVIVSGLTLTGEPITWQGQWSPVTPRTDLPTNPTQQPGLCLAPDTLEQLNPLPVGYSNGKVLMYQKLEDRGTWGLTLTGLDGSPTQVVATEGNWGALSPDGSKVAYSGTDGSIHIVDVATQADQILPNASGYNIIWSPDGTKLAYIGMGNGAVSTTFIVNVDGSETRPISDLSYAGIIGWTPDGNQLYFTVPFTGGAAWKVLAYDFTSNTTQERFTIENGTPKFLNAKLSPDGNRIAYRGRDNSSLYLVGIDGSDMHLVLDAVGAVGVEWTRSGWLGVSLHQPDSSQTKIIVIKPDGCVTYILPENLHGDMEGLFIP